MPRDSARGRVFIHWAAKIEAKAKRVNPKGKKAPLDALNIPVTDAMVDSIPRRFVAYHIAVFVVVGIWRAPPPVEVVRP
jgi:hypothetical protein